LIKALRAIDFTKGLVTTVSDQDMADGMSVVGLNGFDCEMASGAVPAGIRSLRLEGIIKPEEVVVGILTGRQKDPSIPVEYHTNKSNRYAKPPTDN
jgi:threonine synthase